MTVDELIREHPEASQELFNKAFDEGVQAERESWESRLLDDKGTDQVIDELIAAALTP